VNSRQRIRATLSHKEPDMIPVDFGSSPVTGIHVSVVYRLRQYFDLDKPGIPVRITDPYQMLGEIDEDLRKILGADVVGLEGRSTFFGFDKTDWKEWKLFDGTPVLVPGLFNTEINEDGSIYQYAEGDKRYSPSGKMPEVGFFFDAIERQKTIVEKDLDCQDNLEEFNLHCKEDLDYLKKIYSMINPLNKYATMGIVASSGFGDIAFVPGPMLRQPKGIRGVEEWYVSTITRKDYIRTVFSGQLDIALENYKKVYETLGNLMDIVYISGTDFGTQNGLFISIDNYRDLFKPFHIKVNEWIHNNTGWKTFIHSCGAIFELIPDLIEAGFDIINPVQISAAGMEPKKLKKEFGRDVVFWGGGVDTQGIMMFGSPDEVRENVRELIEIFGPGGGFVFNTVHNIQANVPIENVIAMIEVLQEYRK
jgi:hypothetical protein